jgi:hypothetical protein
LPAISGFIVLLGVQRGMPEILLKRLTCLKNAFRTWGGASRKAAWATEKRWTATAIEAYAVAARLGD